MVVTAAERGFVPLSEPETDEEIDKLNLFIRKNNIAESTSELKKIDTSEVFETLDNIPIQDSAEDFKELEELVEIDEENAVLEELDEDEILENVEELEELEEFEEAEGSKTIREQENIEELELVKDIIPLIIEKDIEEVEELETVIENEEIEEFDVDYISSEWIKEYNKNINIIDTVFEEIRKQKMEEETGFAEMAVLEEIKEIEYTDLKNLTLSDKLKILKDEHLLEIYDLSQISELYKKMPGYIEAAEKNVQKDIMATEGEGGKIENTDDSETDFSGISGIFVKNEIDLPVFDNDMEPIEEEEKIEIDLNRIISEENGFDFDMYRGKYTGESSIAYMKALLKISREVKSIYGAILVQDETRYYPEMTVGLNKVNKLLEIKKKDAFYSEILKERKIFYLKTGTGGFPEYDNLFSDEDRSFIKSLLLIPIKFRNKPAYLFLSPDVKVISIEDMLEKVHNLQE